MTATDALVFSGLRSPLAAKNSWRPAPIDSCHSSGKRSKLNTPLQTHSSRHIDATGLLLEDWFAALVPTATANTDYAAASFAKVWSDASQTPSIWAKASAVYNAAIALTLDPLGRLAAVAAQQDRPPPEHSVPEQFAATETALKQLIASCIKRNSAHGTPKSANRSCNGRLATTHTDGNSFRDNVTPEAITRKKSMASRRSGRAPVHGSVRPVGFVGLWQVVKNRRKSAISIAAGRQTGTAKTRSLNCTVTATDTTRSINSTRQSSPMGLGRIPTTGGAQDEHQPPMLSDDTDDADWSDVDTDAGNDEPEAPAVDLQVTRHLTGGMNDSDDSDDEGADVLGDLNQFTVLDRLGRGAEGEVFLAMDTHKNELRAIKAVRRPVSNGLTRVSAAAKQKLDRIAREIAIMKRMRHRNVVALHEVIDDPARDTMYFVLQYVEHGPIATLCEDGTVNATVDPHKLVDYAQQLCSGLSYLHSKGVIHRDIKPENILRGANDQVYLADFGVSENFDGAEVARRIAGTRGTPAFLAPELLQLRSPRRGSLCSVESADEAAAATSPTDVDGEAVDVWALGITLYVLLYGKLPWEFTSAKDLFEEIQRRPIELRQHLSPSLSVSQLSPGFGVDASPLVLSHAPETGGVMMSVTPPLPTPAVNAAATDRLHEPFGRSTLATEAAPPMPDFANSSASDDGYGQKAATTPSLSPALLMSPQLNNNTFGLSTANLSMTGPMARSVLPGQVMASNAADGWRRILFGMLQRDPQKRSKIAAVRNQLRTLHRKLELSTLGASPNITAAFTRLQVQ